MNPNPGISFMSLLGLVGVLAAMALGAWALKRMNPRARARKDGLMNVVAALAVGQKESVVVVEIAGQWLVVGVAPGRVQPIAQMPKAEAAGDEAGTPAGAPDGAAGFANLLKRHLPQMPFSARDARGDARSTPNPDSRS